MLLILYCIDILHVTITIKKAAYYFVTMLIISLVTTCTVFTSNISRYGENEKPVPPCIQKLFFDKIAKIFLMNITYDKNVVMSVKNFFTVNNLNQKNNFVDKFLKPAFKSHVNSTSAGIKQGIMQNNSETDSSGSDSNFKRKKSVKHSKKISHNATRFSLNDGDYSRINQRDVSKLMRYLHKTSTNQEIDHLIDVYKAEIVRQWRQLARVIDNCFALLFFIITMLIFATIVLFFYINVFK